jgi:hypothetical protein
MDLADAKALMGHAEWADALVWRAALVLPREDPELREKLHHLHTVQWVYLHVWRGKPVKPRELRTFATTHALRAWAREYYAELTSYLAGLPADAKPPEVRYPWAARRLRELGVEPPLSDFIAWIWMDRPEADWGDDEAA